MADENQCPFCKTKINEDADVCTGCGAQRGVISVSAGVMTRDEASHSAQGYKKWLIGFGTVMLLGILRALTSDKDGAGVEIIAIGGLGAAFTGLLYLVFARASKRENHWYRKS